MTVIKVVGISHLINFSVQQFSKILPLKFCNFDKEMLFNWILNIIYFLFFFILQIYHIHTIILYSIVELKYKHKKEYLLLTFSVASPARQVSW